MGTDFQLAERLQSAMARRRLDPFARARRPYDRTPCPHPSLPPQRGGRSHPPDAVMDATRRDAAMFPVGTNLSQLSAQICPSNRLQLSPPAGRVGVERSLADAGVTASSPPPPAGEGWVGADFQLAGHLQPAMTSPTRPVARACRPHDRTPCPHPSLPPQRGEVEASLALQLMRCTTHLHSFSQHPKARKPLIRKAARTTSCTFNQLPDEGRKMRRSPDPCGPAGPTGLHDRPAPPLLHLPPDIGLTPVTEF